MRSEWPIIPCLLFQIRYIGTSNFLKGLIKIVFCSVTCCEVHFLYSFIVNTFKLRHFNVLWCHWLYIPMYIEQLIFIHRYVPFLIGRNSTGGWKIIVTYYIYLTMCDSFIILQRVLLIFCWHVTEYKNIFGYSWLYRMIIDQF